MPSKKYPQARVCQFTKVTIASDSFQHKNAIMFGKRRGGSRKSILGASSKLGERHNLKIFGTEGLDRPLRHGRSG